MLTTSYLRARQRECREALRILESKPSAQPSAILILRAINSEYGKLIRTSVNSDNLRGK